MLRNVSLVNCHCANTTSAPSPGRCGLLLRRAVPKAVGSCGGVVSVREHSETQKARWKRSTEDECGASVQGTGPEWGRRDCRWSWASASEVGGERT